MMGAMRGWPGARWVAGAVALTAPLLFLDLAWPSVPAPLLEALRLGRPAARAEAPAFERATLDGKPVRLADLRGRVVLLYFWATW